MSAYGEQAPALEAQVAEVRAGAVSAAQAMTRTELVDAIENHPRLAQQVRSSATKEDLVPLFADMEERASDAYQTLSGQYTA